jgi:hypothetical protein
MQGYILRMINTTQDWNRELRHQLSFLAKVSSFGLGSGNREKADSLLLLVIFKMSITFLVLASSEPSV